METKLKFNQTQFETPSDGEICLCFNKFNDFKILSWDDMEVAFYDEENGVYYSQFDCPIWAYLPKKECKEFVSKSTIK